MWESRSIGRICLYLEGNFARTIDKYTKVKSVCRPYLTFTLSYSPVRASSFFYSLMISVGLHFMNPNLFFTIFTVSRVRVGLKDSFATCLLPWVFFLNKIVNGLNAVETTSAHGESVFTFHSKSSSGGGGHVNFGSFAFFVPVYKHTFCASVFGLLCLIWLLSQCVHLLTQCPIAPHILSYALACARRTRMLFIFIYSRLLVVVIADKVAVWHVQLCARLSCSFRSLTFFCL